MLSRIRHSINVNVEFQFDGPTQVDETFVGGKNKNRNRNKKLKKSQRNQTMSLKFQYLQFCRVFTKANRHSWPVNIYFMVC